MTHEEIMASPVFEMIEKLVKSIDQLTLSINYHSSVIGYQADTDNTDKEVTIQLTCETPAESTSTPQPTFDEVKTALNAYAKKHGKDQTLEILRKYQPDADLKKVKEDQYSDLMKEII